MIAPVLAGRNCFGYGNKKKYITIHQTGNSARGAGAKMHGDYQINNTKYPVIREASWHWTVDENVAIQSFPHEVSCWHASDGAGDGNVNSIGIEACINIDGNYVQSVKNMAKLTAIIMKQESIPLENVRQHYDWDKSRLAREGKSHLQPKSCPAQIRSGKDGIDWNVFIGMVKQELGKDVVVPAKKPTPAPAPKPVVDASATKIIRKYGELGSFKVTDPEGIIVRDKPSISGNKLAVYEKNELLEKYHTVHLGNGYVWIQYTRGGGKGEAYMPIREFSIVNGKEEYGKPWGVLGGVKNIVAPKAVAKPAPAPAPKPKKQYVQLAKTVSSWNVYRIGDKPVNGNQCATLNPKASGGLEYEILGWSQKNTVAIIKTHDFGKVQIFVADRDAKLVWK